MKRKCKNTDIKNKEFIKTAVEQCFARKGKKVFYRRDVRELMEWCDSSIDKLVDMLQSEIANRNVTLPPVRYEERYDRSNGKKRHIMIEHIKQQCYNYIASNGLEDIAGRIGHYQIAGKIGQGPIFGAKVIMTWMRDSRYAAIADIQKCYPSISKKYMMCWLRQHVKNDDLIYLISCLLETSDGGLPIGSYLSVRLCALYISDLYISISTEYFSTRRGKRRNCVKHVMINADDIYIFGDSAKDLHRVMRGTIKHAEAVGLTIKPGWKLIDCGGNQNSHVDVLGYRIYKDHITMRRRNYIKTKRALREFRTSKNIRTARKLLAYDGLFLHHTNSHRFRQKYQTSGDIKAARKVVSHYDKSKVRREAARACNVPGRQFDAVHDCRKWETVH